MYIADTHNIHRHFLIHTQTRLLILRVSDRYHYTRLVISQTDCLTSKFLATLFGCVAGFWLVLSVVKAPEKLSAFQKGYDFYIR